MFKLLKFKKISHRLMCLVMTAVLAFVGVMMLMLFQFKESTLEQKRTKTRHVVETAHSFLAHYERLVQEGVLSLDEAKAQAMDTVRNLRYETDEYFWINDMDVNMLMHPYKPQLDGQNLSDLTDPNGKRPFIEFVATVEAAGAGFVYYQWPKPGADQPVDKVSYVKGFSPWGWVIGSGVYLDDVDALFLAQTRKTALVNFVVMGLVVILSTLISRGITRPLGRAVDVAASIAKGDLDNEIVVATQDESGKMLHALAAMQQQIRERIDEDQRVGAETNRLKRALDNIMAKVMVTDTEHNIIYVNATIESMFNAVASDIKRDYPQFPVGRLLGCSICDIQRDSGFDARVLDQLGRPRHSVFSLGTIQFDVVASPIHNAAGERVGTVFEWKNITSEREVEAEVRSIVEGVMAGDLSRRIPLDDKDGLFATLSEGINDLVAISDQVIGDTVRVLGGAARGELTESIERDYEGAFDELKSNVNGTISRLSSVIAELKMGADRISSDAREISEGNKNLSERTEDQAARLEQTSQSMVEMTGTVKKNAENAAQASELAASARDQAHKGGVVVSQTVAAMAEINNSSTRIADITSVIDEIAFQTNLLALNAAVEAARAGENGRGFAVVASEVRNLAQRSAEAAKEIKMLIDDSVGKVHGGSKLVDESGRTLEQIVESVTKVSDFIADIAKSGQEQSEGIVHVNQAVARMDEMTQQNSALVEQAAAASQSMNDQAQSMQQMMAFFSVADTPQGTKSAPAGRAPLRAAAPTPTPTPPEPRAVASVKAVSNGVWTEF